MKNIKNYQSFHPKVDDFVDHIKMIPGDKTVTLVGKTLCEAFDIDASGVVGYNITHVAKFKSCVHDVLTHGGAVTIRQFTDDKVEVNVDGKQIQVPHKNVYGLSVRANAKLIPLTKFQLMHFYGHSHADGSTLELEPDVDYMDVPQHFFA